MNKKAFLVIGLLLPYSLYLNGMDINIQLIMAVANNNEKEVQDLINQGADVDVRWHLDRTPLHIAALKGHENIVKTLVDNGAKIDAKDNDGSTPLHIASQKGHENIVKTLVDNDADVNARDNAGKTPAELATNLSIKNYLRKLALQEKDEVLFYAVLVGDVTRVEELVANHADVNARDKDGDAPLHVAVGEGHEAVARILIQKGANINARGFLGQTPLHVAVGEGHEAAARILIQNGADVNPKDEYGDTPLHCAGRFLEITKLLVYAGADVNCRNFYYQTPLDVAESREVKEFLQTIVQKEALPVPFKEVLPVSLIDIKSLDIILILDNGDEHSSSQEAMRVTLEDAIKQNIFIITSSPLLYALSKEDEISPLSDSHRWTVYLNKGAKDFVLLIPHPFFLIQLDSLGFNPDQFDRIDPGDIKSTFSSEDYSRKPINIENFKKLFKMPDVKKGASAQEIRQKIRKLFPKRIYLAGHGMEGNTIAKIPIIKYGEFLNILNMINTEFLFVSSCYAGGKNLLEIQSSLEKIARTIPLRYPLVIGATTDEITVRSKSDFNEFFVRLNKWLEGRRFYLGRPTKREPTEEQPILIKDVLMPLFRATPALVNLPSVRFPGTRSFFRAVAVDKMLILTYIRLKAFTLEKVYAKQTGIKPPGREPGDIPITSDLKAVLLYPSILHGVKFCIHGVEVPLFISKISGKAQHFIERIECKGLNFLEAVIKIFLSPIIAPKGFGATDKAWFIDDVTAKDASYKGVVILKPGGIDGPKAPARILYKKNGQFFGIKSRLPVRTSLIPVSISKEEYDEQVLEICKKTVPEARALREATAGHESLAMIKKAFQKFMKKVGIIIEERKLSFISPKIMGLSKFHKLKVA